MSLNLKLRHAELNLVKALEGTLEHERGVVRNTDAPGLIRAAIVEIKEVIAGMEAMPKLQEASKPATDKEPAKEAPAENTSGVNGSSEVSSLPSETQSSVGSASESASSD